MIANKDIYDVQQKRYETELDNKINKALTDLHAKCQDLKKDMQKLKDELNEINFNNSLPTIQKKFKEISSNFSSLLVLLKNTSNLPPAEKIIPLLTTELDNIASCEKLLPYLTEEKPLKEYIVPLYDTFYNLMLSIEKIYEIKSGKRTSPYEAKKPEKSNEMPLENLPKSLQPKPLPNQKNVILGMSEKTLAWEANHVTVDVRDYFSGIINNLNTYISTHLNQPTSCLHPDNDIIRNIIGILQANSNSRFFLSNIGKFKTLDRSVLLTYVELSQFLKKLAEVNLSSQSRQVFRLTNRLSRTVINPSIEQGKALLKSLEKISKTENAARNHFHHIRESLWNINTKGTKRIPPISDSYSIHNLPLEILHIILHYLLLPDLIKLTLTARKFYQLAWTEIINAESKTLLINNSYYFTYKENLVALYKSQHRSVLEISSNHYDYAPLEFLNNKQFLFSKKDGIIRIANNKDELKRLKIHATRKKIIYYVTLNIPKNNIGKILGIKYSWDPITEAHAEKIKKHIINIDISEHSLHLIKDPYNKEETSLEVKYEFGRFIEKYAETTPTLKLK